MIVKFDIPDVDTGPIKPERILRKIFRGEGPADYQDNAIIENLARLAQYAAVEYSLGKEVFTTAWSDRSTIGNQAYLRASTHFESCVTNIVRAVKLLDGIRYDDSILPRSRHRIPINSEIFSSDSQRRMTDLRNDILHQDERILKGQFTEKQFPLLMVNGDEVPMPNNTLKTMDRLEIGRNQILFSELNSCISEVRNIVSSLIECEYEEQV